MCVWNHVCHYQRLSVSVDCLTVSMCVWNHVSQYQRLSVSVDCLTVSMCVWNHVLHSLWSLLACTPSGNFKICKWKSEEFLFFFWSVLRGRPLMIWGGTWGKNKTISKISSSPPKIINGRPLTWDVRHKMSDLYWLELSDKTHKRTFIKSSLCSCS